MAKSIRSKVKKRNRTEMRKNVGDPHQRKLQARCTAKIQKSIAFSAGESVTKLKTMISAAQEVNPRTQEVSKSAFSFRHPDAPPPLLDDDYTTVLSNRTPTRPRGRSRSLSDAEASMADEDSKMDDVKDMSPGATDVNVRSSVSRANGRRASEAAIKEKKKEKRARRRGWVDFPALENE